MEAGGRNDAEVPRFAGIAMEDGNANPHPFEGEEGGVIRNPNEYLPISNINKIMRRVLPPHAKVADDAKETVQECVTEFISFITGEANTRCHSESRKTITAEDVLTAMAALGFDDYVGPLTVYLNNHRAQDPLRRAAPAIAPPPRMDRRFMGGRGGGGTREGSSSAGAEFGQ